MSIAHVGNAEDDRVRPTGPYHDFFLLQDCDGRYVDSIGETADIRLADDIVEYLYDSFEWISTINPSNPGEWRGHGLNRWGPTVVNHTGAGTALRVFLAWAELFSAGPPEFELRGPWTTWPDGRSGYTRLLIVRDDLVWTMQKLAGYAQRCTEGKWYILHVGV
jgi:hypothetical protein